MPPLVSQAVSQAIREALTGSDSDPKYFFGPKLSTHVVDYCGRSSRRAPRSERASSFGADCRRFMTSNRSICGKWHPRSPLPSPSPRSKSRWLRVREGKSSIPVIVKLRRDHQVLQPQFGQFFASVEGSVHFADYQWPQAQTLLHANESNSR